MKILGHLAGGYLVTRGLVKYLNLDKSNERKELLLFGTIAGALPDSDYLFYVIKKRRIAYDEDFQHHTWLTHTFPFYLIPGIAIFAYGNLSKKEGLKSKSIVFMGSTVMHLIQDTIGSGDGIMLFYPLTKTMYGIGLSGLHGKEWNDNYVKSRAYWVEISLIVLSIIVLIKDVLFKKKKIGKIK